ncbi:Protein arginine methyltransferase NDUFAF7, mitochondrial [Lamellibrachia satsuma]|nr:Protein arginine methyltransferase NDUFAF7, mitochondrial [Lamellibrachia satsuma]
MRSCRWLTRRNGGVMTFRTRLTRISSLLHIFKRSTCGCRRYLHVPSSRRWKSAETEMVKQLKARIRLTGPLSVADYMKEVLTNPSAGYYMHQDVFGTKGDFITSPEISQMFGELIAIWCVNEWMQCGSPSSIQVVELGPGRGTLADDMLRVFAKFEGIRDAVSLHMVEVSPKLSEMQQEKLSGTPASQCNSDATNPTEGRPCMPGQNQSTITGAEEMPSSDKLYKSCQSKYGVPVSWYRNLQDVPQGFSFYVAHEFFDALPVHKFQKKDGHWHEVMVDMDYSPDAQHHLHFVLSQQNTTAGKLLLQIDPNEQREHIEQSPDSGVLVQELAARIASDGGFALIADYGHTGDKTDTFRAFRDHKLHDPLCEPGTADLTADVDFAYLKSLVTDKVACCGPITQQMFLHNMGIQVRLQMLMKTAEGEQMDHLISGYEMLTNPKKMGERFKFLCLLQHNRNDYEPAGFVPPL